ncbi:MAG: EutN/CcmL family microcompartment protein [Elusimicrobia bacterium]|nr:EutN/CcmL family microcompartment protein [Elusimicrobiota bacterium]
MIFARVVGNVVCTTKDEKLVGTKLLLVQPVDLADQPKGNPLVAIDAVGAGEGEHCAIFAIVDTIEKDGKTVFNKGKDKVGA